MAASMRAKIRSASALVSASRVCSGCNSVSGFSVPTLAACSMGLAVVLASLLLLFGAGSVGIFSGSAARGWLASLRRSGKLRLRLAQLASGSLLRNGPTTRGQSAFSPAPGTITTTPLGSLLLAGFQSARKVSCAACSCCCSAAGTCRSSAVASSWLRSGKG